MSGQAWHRLQRPPDDYGVSTGRAQLVARERAHSLVQVSEVITLSSHHSIWATHRA